MFVSSLAKREGGPRPEAGVVEGALTSVGAVPPDFIRSLCAAPVNHVEF